MDLLKISGIPRSTYYFEGHKEDYDIRNKDIMEAINNIFNANKGSYGFQKGDGTASISPQQQWLQATQFIADQFGND